MEEYLKLLDLSYEDAVEHLLKKYGGATEDYFKEKSYERFLNNEIKTISKGKISRSDEGLYCHHIKENMYQNMANVDFIINQKIPFEHQTKENLVYCDLVEHTILHAIITKETDYRFGKQGLDAFLMPTIFEWYVQGLKPSMTWMVNCYEKSYLTMEQAEELLKVIQDYILF